MAIGAMIALVHDVLITAGVYALVGREVTPETVIAILTILGYSLYDTVVIFDKIQENTESTAARAPETATPGVVNMSLNQTLMRSVNTSLVVLLPILSLLLFGGDTLKDFAFALFVGVADRGVLVDLRRRADARAAEGARAALPADQERTARRATGRHGHPPSRRRERRPRSAQRRPRPPRGAARPHHRHARRGAHRPQRTAGGRRASKRRRAEAEAEVEDRWSDRRHDQGGPDPRRPGLPAAGHRLQGHHPAAGRRRRASPRSSTSSSCTTAAATSTRWSASRPAGSSWPRRSRTTSAPASCPSARRASSRGRPIARSTSSSTGPRRWRSTGTPSARASAS